MSLSCTAQLRDRDLDVEVRVAQGETLALLGPNGAGKSTVLALVAGLLRPDSGRVEVSGRVLTDDRTWVSPHRRRVALLAQEPMLFPHLSALDNVAFGPRCRGVRRRDAARLAHSWLDRLDLAELAERRPSQLSGGQAQRVAIARALATDPELLLLDEPLAALDVEVAPAVRETLRRVLADRTAIVVTHEVVDAALLADRIVVLDAGRVVESGPSTEVLSRPRSPFGARIAGLNLVVGAWHDRHVASAAGPLGGEVVGPAPSACEEAIAVFRPSAVAVYREAPAGSPRNVLPVVVSDLQPLGDRVRVRAGDLSADVTAAAVADLALAPGAAVHFVVKATEVQIYRR